MIDLSEFATVASRRWGFSCGSCCCGGSLQKEQHILLVEDDVVDERMFKRALWDLRISIPVVVVHIRERCFKWCQRIAKITGKHGVCLLLTLFLSGLPSIGALQEEPETDYFDLSFDELAEQWRATVSASRRPQKLGELSVPVSVITAQDIHYSGLTSIPEILQFSVGMDVLRLDRNRYAVGVRGLHVYTSDRTLTLINGRIANSPVYGGSEFYRLPVLMDDIERIEVVRGPGGAAWGANAFTGLINIITKKPQDSHGLFTSAMLNEFGDSYSHLRWARNKNRWDWRISAGYEDKNSSDAAGTGQYSSTASPTVKGIIGFNNYRSDDFSRDIRFDTELNYASTEQTTLSFNTGYTHNESGNFEFGGYCPAGHTVMDTVRPHARINHQFDSKTTGYLQWFCNYAKTMQPTFTNFYSVENDLEAQLDFELWDNHAMSGGANVRSIHIDTKTRTAQDTFFNGAPFDEQLAGLFLIDRWTMSKKFTLEGQMRMDWYSETQTDWSGRFSTLYSLDEQSRHIIRASWARSYRTPLACLRTVSIERIQINATPPLYGFNVLQPNELNNENTWSLEGGYTGDLGQGRNVRANAYYQRFENMIGYNTLPDPLSLGRSIYQTADVGGADSRGVELEYEQMIKTAKLSAWYAFNDFDRDNTSQNLRSYAPAKHKVGLLANQRDTGQPLLCGIICCKLLVVANTLPPPKTGSS